MPCNCKKSASDLIFIARSRGFVRDWLGALEWGRSCYGNAFWVILLGRFPNEVIFTDSDKLRYDCVSLRLLPVGG
jgi:hypothetical protein